MGQIYVVVKVFDLARAPPELREARDFVDLRPAPGRDATPILEIEVGAFDTAGMHDGAPHRAITLAQYQLHRWLEAGGARKGEAVLLRWSSAVPAAISGQPS